MSGGRSDVAPGGGQGIERRYELFDGLFGVKDWSLDPADNTDRLAKIGNQQGARVALICDFEEANHKRFTQDGLTSPKGGESMSFHMEPDWLWFRKQLDGGDLDQNWAPRMLLDEKHEHASKENRTTGIIDQADEQNQGFLHDFFKIKDVRAVGTEPETFITAAGESVFACTDGTPSSTERPRYHFMMNFFNQAGYVTDAEAIAQLKHLFKIIPFSTDTPTGGLKAFDFPCATVPPYVQDESADGDLENVDGELFGELALWSDLIFYQDATHRGPLGINPIVDQCPEGELRFGGFLWSTRRAGSVSDQEFPDPANKDNGKLESELEDSPEFGRKTRVQYLRPWIRVPESEIPRIPVPTPGNVPTTFPGRPSPTTSPQANSVGVFHVDRFRTTGNDFGYHFTIPIPNVLGTGVGCNLGLNFITPAAGLIGDVDVRIEYAVVAKSADASPVAVTDTLSKTLNRFEFAGLETLECHNFFVPAADIAGNEDGKLSVAFYRSGGDDQLDDLDVILIDFKFGPDLS